MNEDADTFVEDCKSFVTRYIKLLSFIEAARDLSLAADENLLWVIFSELNEKEKEEVMKDLRHFLERELK